MNAQRDPWDDLIEEAGIEVFDALDSFFGYSYWDGTKRNKYSIKYSSSRARTARGLASATLFISGNRESGMVVINAIVNGVNVFSWAGNIHRGQAIVRAFAIVRVFATILNGGTGAVAVK